MATNTTRSNNTIKTRIQLKSDTEENWKKSVLTTDHPEGLKQSGISFVPLLGELIVFSADSTHPFSRLKIGDGNTNVLSLPFIDSGTLNGNQPEIIKKETFRAFPALGSPDKLYIDLSTSRIYHYVNTSGYMPISNSKIVSWNAGARTLATIQNNTLQIANGELPELLLARDEL